MHVIKSFCSAFLMYSRIPVPQVEWREENRRYALCFFPLIGCVIGILFLLWYRICDRFGVDTLLFATGSVAISLFVTGGIHLDGFCDVNDALACGGTRERKLEVMKDSHIGAFAAIHLAVYLLLLTGVFSQVKEFDMAVVCALSFVQSRAWSALAAVTFKNAKSEGALMNFKEPAHKEITVVAEVLFLVITAAIMLCQDRVGGSFGILGGVFSFLYYRFFSDKKFGGITGDLAGYFLQICELATITFAVLGGLFFGGVFG